jgi:regulatory protein
VDGEFRLAISAELALQSGLRVGRELATGELELLEGREEARGAREAGLRLLAHRPRTEQELRQRLAARAFSAAAVADAIQRISALGLIDDAAFARLFAEQRIRSRPAGAHRLVQELRRKGVPEADARSAVEEALRDCGTSDLELARVAMRKFPNRPSEPLPKKRRRLQGYLARRGFSASVVSRVIREWEGA